MGSMSHPAIMLVKISELRQIYILPSFNIVAYDGLDPVGPRSLFIFWLGSRARKLTPRKRDRRPGRGDIYREGNNMNACNYCILLEVDRMEEVKGVVAGHKIVCLEGLGLKGATLP